MDVSSTIQKRRAYRNLDPSALSENELKTLKKAVQLAPSCFNNQPWRYVFVTDEKTKDLMKSVLSNGNKWANHASMYIAVCARENDDCVIYDRKYYLFDTGIATGFLILQATALGYVAHPIAGYSPKKTRKVLGIPADMQVIALVILGRHRERFRDDLSEKQRKIEIKRPQRKSIEEIIYDNQYKKRSKK